MNLQLMLPEVLSLSQPAGMPGFDLGIPVAAFLPQLLLSNIVFWCQGSSCDGEIDLQLSPKTMAQRAACEHGAKLTLAYIVSPCPI
jgi:hypothetical protein